MVASGIALWSISSTARLWADAGWSTAKHGSRVRTYYYRLLTTTGYRAEGVRVRGSVV